MGELFWLVIWAAAIFLCFNMAKERGRSTSLAIVGGVLFGWLAVIYYALAGKKS